MSRSTPPTPSSPFSSSSSLAASIPPFSTTSTTRLQALYSDFSRQKQSNPTSYHANVDWWQKALEALVSSGAQGYQNHLQTEGDDGDHLPTKSERLLLHAGRDLIEGLKIPKVGKPLALGAVLFELQHTNRSVLPLHVFLNTKTSIYDPGWLPARIAKVVVGKPLWWALEQVGIVGEEGILGSLTGTAPDGGGGRRSNWWGDYVLISLVEKAATEVVERQARREMGSMTVALYTMEQFRRVFGGAAGGGDEMLREMDAKILVKYLERDRGVLVVDKEVIKFVDRTSPLEERTITAVDHGILELKTAVSNLQAQVDTLHNKIDECTKKATAALRQNRKPAALGYIKTRKRLEDVLQKRLGSLSTLESTFINVEAAAGDVEIMKSYESSTNTLRAILAHPALQRSKIEETMEALAEANADAKEIDEVIRVGADIAVGVADAVDEGELEEEWKALVRELESEKEPKKEEQRQKSEDAAALEDVRVEEKEPKLAIAAT